VKAGADPKIAANWVMGEVMTSYNESRRFPVSAERLAQLIQLVAAGIVSHQAAKRVYTEVAASDQDPGAAAERLGLIQVSDEGALARWVDEILAAHPGEVDRFRSGETKLLGFFVGQVMKRSKGKADPKAIQPLLQSRLQIAAGTQA
jgi:aspartyl-tRNA(Asn)/glutamyl-tRNA(Gln) amidotransferase subunit B